MPHRIRHCVECPKCLTQYLIGFSPYSNRSYLVPSVVGSSEEYTLYCSCRVPHTVSRWSRVRSCRVSKAAYSRGYGTPEEVAPVSNQTWTTWSFDITRYLNLALPEKGRNS
jgi:hypothetical protein